MADFDSKITEQFTLDLSAWMEMLDRAQGIEEIMYEFTSLNHV